MVQRRSGGAGGRSASAVLWLLLGLSLSATACAMQTPAQQQLASHAPGTYSTTAADGQRYELVLNPDGSGHLNGQPGTWQVQMGRIFISDGQNYVPADLVGDQLTVHLPDGAVVFVREGGGAVAQGGAAGGVAGQGGGVAGGAGGAAPAGPAKKFQPEGTLAGDVVAPAGSGAEFTVPDGWTHGPTRSQDGSEAYGIQNKTGAGMVITRKVLSATEQRTPVSTLLQQSLQKEIGNHPVEVVVPAEDLDIAGQRAARTILRGDLNGRQMELYFAGVVVGHYGFVMGALYESSASSQVRPAVDTVLSTFRGSIPEENQQLRSQLLGCWEHYEADTSVNGSFNTTTRISLQPNGTYSYRYYSSVTGSAGMGGTSEKSDSGRYRVEGNTVVGVSDQDGSVSSYTAQLQGGILYLNGTKYLPCRN